MYYTERKPKNKKWGVRIEGEGEEGAGNETTLVRKQCKLLCMFTPSYIVSKCLFGIWVRRPFTYVLLQVTAVYF